jgi:hypothetical protein
VNAFSFIPFFALKEKIKIMSNGYDNGGVLMNKNILLNFLFYFVLIFGFSLIIFDGIHTKKSTEKEIYTLMNEKGYKIHELNVVVSSNRAYIDTDKGNFIVENIHDINNTLYKKEYIHNQRTKK